MATKTYNVVSGLSHAGKFYKPGKTIDLSDRQAQYLLLGGQITEGKAKSTPAVKVAKTEPDQAAVSAAKKTK